MPVTIEEIVAEDVTGKIDRERLKNALRQPDFGIRLHRLKTEF